MFAPRLLVATLLSLGLPTASVAAETTMTVHVDRPGAKISPMLYGIFFEEINRAGDGGLYAEMLQNRSFEDDRGDRDQKPTKIPGWDVMVPPGTNATFGVDNSEPLDAQNPHSLRLEITSDKADQIPIVVSNSGFGGLALVKGASYELSFYARCDKKRSSGLLTVLLGDKGGPLSEPSLVHKVGNTWQLYRATLTATRTSTCGRLGIMTSSPGTLWLDQVSLFPKKTWKGRQNGLRPDLARMLADMKPSFNRFPGGCYVEGNRLHNAFRWKNSIGDLAQRPGHWNLWGYRSTDGLGYYEYLQLCEDIGATPLFVINCGMAHEDSVPDNKLGPWIQDALDAIEYANGPVDSHWARSAPKRATRPLSG